MKRFFIKSNEKTIITKYKNSYLEKIFTDYRPMAEMVFAKKRGQDREENMELNLEEFISVKGINAMGNQLTKEKVLEINAMEALPYEPPAPVEPEEMDVVEEEEMDAADETSTDDNDEENQNDSKIDEGGQGLLF